MIKKFAKTNFNSSQGHFALLVLRLGAGAFMLTHGFPKLMKLLEGNFAFADPFGLGQATTLVLAVFSEAICSTLLILGLFTRLAAVPLAFTMSVAAFMQHSTDPFGVKEKALLYLIIFVALLFLGSGKYSLDRALLKK